MQISDWLNGACTDAIVTDVITLKPTDRLADAASEFLRNQISGAPVVDEDGKCIGVLSVTDVVRAPEKVAQRQAEALDEFFEKSDLVLPTSVYEDKLSQVRDRLSEAAEQPVSNFMVTDLVTVHETDSLERVVRSFVDAHVHRVIVTDADGRLKGIISTIDVMALLLRISH